MGQLGSRLLGTKPAVKRKPAKSAKPVPVKPASAKKEVTKASASNSNQNIPKRIPPKTVKAKSTPKRKPAPKGNVKKKTNPRKAASQKKEKQEINGEVEFIYDADTVYIKTQDGKKERLRLLGIDAPEMNQEYGSNARDALRLYLPQGTHIRAVVHARDQYGRALAHLYRGASHVNRWLVRNGYAWNCGGGAEFRALETEAKQKKYGLWGKGRPINPSDHRHRNKK